jgi:hypothetical protein
MVFKTQPTPRPPRRWGAACLAAILCLLISQVPWIIELGDYDRRVAQTRATLEALAKYRRAGGPVSAGDWFVDAWGRRIRFSEPDPRRGSGWVIWSSCGSDGGDHEPSGLILTEKP